MATPDAEISKDARTFAMLCHLLALVLGVFGPLIIWLIKKDEHPFVDEQGKEAVNFELSILIGCFICIPLAFLIIGIPLMFALMIYGIVFRIIGAIKANDGVHFRYPYRLQLIK
ncbi:DUF4870 domain-containing protein [Planctomycetota bacterium]